MSPSFCKSSSKTTCPLPHSPQRYRDNFGAVVDSERYQAVADAPADHGGALAVGVQPLEKFGEEILVGSNQPADKRHSHLAAVGVAAERKVGARVGVSLGELGAVGEQQVKLAV